MNSDFVPSLTTKNAIDLGLEQIHATLYPYQLRSAQFLYEKKFALTADVMGLGKTLEIITAFATYRLLDNPRGKILVVCPSILKTNWHREFTKFFPDAFCFMAKKVKDVPKSFGNYDVVIVNYEQLKACFSLFKEADVLVADECHYLLNSFSKRTQYFYNMLYASKRSKMCFLASGTPLKNRVPELYSLFKILDLCPSDSNGEKVTLRYPNYFKFCDDFCYTLTHFVGNRAVKKYVGCKNETVISGFLKQKMIRHEIEGNIELPPIVRTIREIEPTKEVLDAIGEEHKSLWEAYAAEGKAKVGTSLSGAKAASATQKAPYTVARVLELNEQELLPCVVFSDHVLSSQLIASMLVEKRLRVGLITGETPTTMRQALVDAFQVGQLDVLVATIPTLQAGITLTASNRIIFNDLPWEPSGLEQASKRIHRIGQDRTCFIDIMVFTDIDSMVAKTIDAKFNIIGKVVGGTYDKLNV